MEGGVSGMETVTTNLTAILGFIINCVQDVWDFVTGDSVLPYLLVGVGVSLFFVGVKSVKSLFWGVS